jgi:hypothetical protein
VRIHLLAVARLAAAGAPTPAARLGAAGSLDNVFPRDRGRFWATAARIEAARGEREAFQVVVEARTALAAVRAHASDLVGPGRIAAANVRLHRVAYLDLRTPSSIEGGTGAWPDPLVPDRDACAGELRNAFPFAVPAGERRAIWVEIEVPADAPPGICRGAVAMTDGARTLGAVPVELRVRAVIRPREPALPVTFGFSGASAARGHRLPADEPTVRELAVRYQRAALAHRFALHYGSGSPASWRKLDERLEIDPRPFER